MVVETVTFLSMVPGDVHLDADNSRSIISMLFVSTDEVYPRAISILKLPKKSQFRKNEISTFPFNHGQISRG